MNTEKNPKHSNSDLPLVSIITVVKNAEKVLERTIKSIIAQAYPAIEYIIVDGVSQDNTLKIIKKYEKHISRWISEPDKGIFDAMNKGLKLAKGRYVWFLCAGSEIYDSNALKKAFETEKNADAYYGETVLTNMEGEEIGWRRRQAPEQLSWKQFNRGGPICHEALIIKKSLVGEYDLQYRVAADDWIITGLKKSKRVVNAHTILCKFLIGGFSKKHEFRGWVERYRTFNKHFGVLNNFFNHFFIITGFILYNLKNKLFK